MSPSIAILFIFSKPLHVGCEQNVSLASCIFFERQMCFYAKCNPHTTSVSVEFGSFARYMCVYLLHRLTFFACCLLLSTTRQPLFSFSYLRTLILKNSVITVEMSFKPDMKLILLGDAHVGKTSLLTRYTQDVFTSCPNVTIGSAFLLREWNNHTIAIWDTAGSEMFNSIPNFHCRGAGAAILAFDINSIKSFDDLSRRFEPMLSEHALPDCLRVVVATKCDLVDDKNPPISRSTAENLAAGLNRHLDVRRLKTAPYFQTSSKTGQGISELFEFIFQHCLVDHPSGQNPAPSQDSFILSADTRTGAKTSVKGKDSNGKCCS